MSNATNADEVEDELFIGKGNYPEYTEEQKIVAAVWVHERKFNFQTMQDIRNNFRIRFRIPPPKRETLATWERRLFSEGTLSNSRRHDKPLHRLKHVPYVKASFRDEPNLSITERANKLGLSKTILRTIIKYDLKEADIKPPNCKEKSYEDLGVESSGSSNNSK